MFSTRVPVPGAAPRPRWPWAIALGLVLAAAGAARTQTVVPPPAGEPVAALRILLKGPADPNLQERQKRIQDLINAMDLEQLSRALLLQEWRTLETAAPTTRGEQDQRDADLGQRGAIAERFNNEAVKSLRAVINARKGRDALLKTAATADLIGETAAAVRQLDRVARLSTRGGGFSYGPSRPPTGPAPPTDASGKIVAPGAGERLNTEPNPVLSLTEQLSQLTPDLVSLTKADAYDDPAAPEAILARRAAARALGQIQPDDSRRIGADSKEVIGALQALLDDPSPALRLTAARSIDDLAQAAAEEMQRSLGIEVDRANYPIHMHFVNTGRAVWRAVLEKGLADQPPEVRRTCLQAFGRIATELLDISVLSNTTLPQLSAGASDEERKLHDAWESNENRFRAGLKDLFADFQNNAGTLGAAVEDRDPEVRQPALTILSDLATARDRLQRLTAAPPAPEPLKTPPTPNPAPPPPPEAKRDAARFLGSTVALAAFADEPPTPWQPQSLTDINKGIDKTLGALRRQLLESPDPETRRAALDVLELLGEADGFTRLGATPFPLDAVILALRDPDKFVRWAAARTLGNLAGQSGADGEKAFGGGDRAARAVRGIASLLTDQDVAVRLAAATALMRFGLAGHTPTKEGAEGPAREPFFGAVCQATPILIASINRSQTEAARAIYPTRETEPDLIKGDPSIRIAAMRALEAIEGGDQDCGDRERALHEAVVALGDGSALVRQGAAEMIGRMGRSADKDLRQKLIDALGHAATDPESDVRRAISGAILSLMGAK